MTGISLANQEDAARATAEVRAKDVVFARDYAAIVEALRVTLGDHDNNELKLALSTIQDCRTAYYAGDEAYTDASFFASQWGVPALLRALARAIELETVK